MCWLDFATRRGWRRHLVLLALGLSGAVTSGAAFADSLQITVSGSGVVQDAANGIACTEAGERSCLFDPVPDLVTVNLTVVPQPGWVFQGWGGGCSSAGLNPSCSLEVSGGATGQVVPVNALLVIDAADLSVGVVGTGQGNVISSGQAPGIDCPGDCSETYPLGTLVTLIATPASPLAVFTGWQGSGCSGTGSCTILMNSGQSVQASFEADSDSDGVLDPSDQCPNSQLNTTVDATGCGPSQLDADNDGVSDAADQCANTPAGESVDNAGCGPSQLDADNDGVSDAADQCANTPAGESVDNAGCGPSQLDADNDGVSDAADQCANTPAGESVDNAGCGPSQLDADNDGISNLDDQCPDTLVGRAVDAAGCSELQLLTNKLGALPGLSRSQRQLGNRVDEICPQLVEADAEGGLDESQRDLRLACSRLMNSETTQSQGRVALDEILLVQLPALQDYLIELGQNQFTQLENRIRTVRSGGGRGASVTGLNIRRGEEMISGAVVQSVFQNLVGMGASEEAFADFGKLGIFLQGDLGSGERDSSGEESGYDLDSWSLTLGADYRFKETLFAGASLNYGEVDVDHGKQAGATDIEHRALALYGSWQISPYWYLDGLASYGESDYRLTRAVSYSDSGGEFSSTHLGDTSGDQIFVGVNTGYTWNRGGWRFGPVAKVAWIRGEIDAYDEQSTAGSQAWNFTVEDRDIESLRVSAGLQVDYIFNTSFGVLIPGVRAAYVRETRGEAQRIGVRLVNNPIADNGLDSDGLAVDVAPRDDSYLDASLNLSAQFPLGISGFFSYRFYRAYDRFSLDTHTFGLRWDKAF